MKRLFYLIILIIVQTFVIMGCKEEPSQPFTGEDFYSLLGERISSVGQKINIELEKTQNYPKSLVFTHRINDDSVSLYGYRVARILLNVRDSVVCALNFLIEGDQGFMNNAIKIIGPPTNGLGLGIEGNSSSAGTTFLWKTDKGCFALSQGGVRRFGNRGEFSYNIVFTLYDCRPSSVLPSHASTQ